ncbi:MULTISPECIES: class I SAM-dependent methyltransferase [unclassified Parafrankia]|uniref:class I SAM-dependent methyltransferase n=1 Tax=Parafrankia TaxID=2994362 RepID=UPI000DA5C955|nr:MULTISPECIES: class I SAM-dependent methyltransferase [unclassified Parafrankia]TCJ40611.1 SAM-dependent methyltransferase [Parafrankia sp. BMG5.11]CAI7974687.1 S-adenosyl-L-methionine-dependent methyltransferase [Frankia sp. Hr75.2]SQD94116.1 putative methyltransferase [Parafrankia sp. Ea1.12]
MPGTRTAAPESTATRVALWRAMHVQVDPRPHVFEDEIGLRLVAPGDDWRARPDMDQHATRRTRASMVARARLVEDLVAEQAGRGVSQYVILGAGLDTFAQRRPEIASGLRMFEVDQPGPQAWKRRRLAEIGFGVPEWLRFVPVDFEVGPSWWERLTAAGFDPTRPAVVVCAGVTMYLTRDATTAMLRQVAALASGSTLVTTFLVPPTLVEPAERALREMTEKAARAARTPFISFFTPPEMLALAREAGFGEARHVSAGDLTRLYFTGRSDDLRPSSSEELLVTTT